MKKIFLSLVVFAFLLAVPVATYALPDVGGNPVAVTKCVQVGNDIQITRDNSTYVLTTACRKTEYGYQFYTMKCTSDTEYYVNWKPCDDSATATKISCTEGDSGLDYYTSSWATGIIEGSTSIATVNDSCGASVGDLNKEKGSYIAERNCSNGYVHTQWYKCENGCENGACLKMTAPTPVETPACSESDKGLDYNVFGNATGQSENGLSKGTFEDSCGNYVGDSGKSEGAYIDEKNCSYGKVHDQWYKCDYGCFKGACKIKPVATPNAKCTETDKLNYNVFGIATGNDELTGAYDVYPDSCGIYIGDKNKVSGNFIAETHCSSASGKNYVHTQWYKCPYGCADGTCLAKPKSDDNKTPWVDEMAKTTITSPDNGSILTNYPRIVDLIWKKVDNANQYQVEVACEKCSQPLWSAVMKWKTYSNTLQTAPLWGDGQFKVRVLPMFPNGFTGQWSDYVNFSYATTATSSPTTKPLPACSDIKSGNSNVLICNGFAIDHYWSGTKIKVISNDGEEANVELAGLSEEDADLVLNTPETFYVVNKPGKYLTITYIGVGAEGRALFKVDSNTSLQDSYSESCTDEKGVDGVYTICTNKSFIYSGVAFQFKVTKYNNNYVWLKMTGAKSTNIALKLDIKKKYTLKKDAPYVELTYFGKSISGGAKIGVHVGPEK